MSVFADSIREIDGKAGSDEDVALFGSLLLKIRKDIVGVTKVTVNEISNLNPFNRG